MFSKSVGKGNKTIQAIIKSQVKSIDLVIFSENFKNYGLIYRDLKSVTNKVLLSPSFHLKLSRHGNPNQKVEVKGVVFDLKDVLGRGFCVFSRNIFPGIIKAILFSLYVK